MSKILLINPSKWGRGITPIWIASHSAVLKKNIHDVKLFDATFYSKWSLNEVKLNTLSEQYKPTDYEEMIVYKDNDIFIDLQNLINDFSPDIIFWSAISSHIHGEGEYVNIEYGYDLVKNLKIKNALLVTGGIQATASPTIIFENFNKINFLIGGESEFVLNEMAHYVKDKNKLIEINGVSYLKNKNVKTNTKQKIIRDLDLIPNYDYSLFEDQIFLRPYNGKVLRAIDYELSRGCIYTCSYCVETVIQNYYGFNEKSLRGALVGAKNYLRSKSAKRIYEELSHYKKKYKIDFVRCQDTNFLTINRKVLKEFEEIIMREPLGLKLYIETRPEGINEKTANILMNIGVDGVGMGIELSGQEFREEELNRYSNENSIIKAFNILKKYGIKRTSYNIIGLPNQNETSIKNTIIFNRKIEPDNITVAYYSPYLGTEEQRKSFSLNYFKEYEKDVDGQLRSVAKNSLVSIQKLQYYKNNFKKLVFNDTFK